MRKTMHLLVAILLGFSSLTLVTSGFAAEQLDGIAATVNNNIITISELNQRVIEVKQQLKQRKIKLPSNNVLSKQVLQMMVNQNLEKQTANRLHITATDADANRAINNIATQQKLTITQLYQSLSKQGISKKEFSKEIKQQIVTEKLLHEVVATQVNVTTQEIDAGMKMALSQTGGQNEFHLLHILIPVPDSPSPKQIAAAKLQAQQLVGELKSGESFKTLAAAQSRGAHMFNGGDWGWKTLTELPTVFANQVPTMKKGETVGPIKTANGFHIIKLIGTRGQHLNMSKTQLRERVRAMIMQRKLAEKQQAWIEQLRATSYIKILYKPKMLPTPL